MDDDVALFKIGAQEKLRHGGNVMVFAVLVGNDEQLGSTAVNDVLHDAEPRSVFIERFKADEVADPELVFRQRHAFFRRDLDSPR